MQSLNKWKFPQSSSMLSSLQLPTVKLIISPFSPTFFSWMWSAIATWAIFTWDADLPNNLLSFVWLFCSGTCFTSPSTLPLPDRRCHWLKRRNCSMEILEAFRFLWGKIWFSWSLFARGGFRSRISGWDGAANVSRFACHRGGQPWRILVRSNGSGHFWHNTFLFIMILSLGSFLGEPISSRFHRVPVFWKCFSTIILSPFIGRLLSSPPPWILEQLR